MWGLWAEVDDVAFRRILELWADPEQDKAPAMPGTLANRVPGYPDTTGLPVVLKMTGVSTRPALAFEDLGRNHPFVNECTDGVTTHRLMEWLDAFRTPVGPAQ